MSDYESDYDLRQLTKMRQQIDSYYDGNIGLDSLIGDLIFLRDALFKVEQEWEHEFNNCIVDLESIYCTILEKNVEKPSDLISKEIIDDAIQKLSHLIKRRVR